MSTTRQHLADVPTTRWKNGKGTTRELLRIPARNDPDDFVLRVSVADMNADGAFSLYPGIDRITAILRGSGIDLIDESDGAVWETLAGRFSSLAFAGERQLRGRLLGAPVQDFNVMVSRDAGVAALRIVDGPCTVPVSTCRLLFVAQGSACIVFDDGGTLVLDASEFIEPIGAASIAMASDSVAFLVDFSPLD
ncbi:HutD family protein [Caballeronia sp. LZ029]|uniref:HutD/Ves family protein n=1 Tax=Caballeronia sp. LZ029 TaxID=3038564 RepID=UPI0028556164|nr:HutD family protein [Caballeronia sp. LZ029]MDR5744689.1 HutD family protein [Caballeronia sp. LZ029]